MTLRDRLIAAFEGSQDFVGSPDLIADVALEALDLDDLPTCPDCDEPDCPGERTADD